MFDHSAYREPDVDAQRQPSAEIWDDSVCANCSSSVNLRVTRDGNWVLCSTCYNNHD